jgi:general secretion pathway protein B
MRAAEAIAVVAVQPQSTEQVGTDENRPLSSTVDRTTTEMPRKAAAPTVVAWRDLPHEQRKGLPRPHLDVHVHADDPSGRFVMVGMRKYREGDTLPDGSLLERILADGVQLEFRGPHYRLPRR